VSRHRFRLSDLDATAVLARRIARGLRPGATLAIDGSLGAGKTTLVRFLVAELGGDPTSVASPTYTLLHRYDADLPVWHVDAYRLSGDEELAELGIDELGEGGIVCVEWAERCPGLGCDGGIWHLHLGREGEHERSAELSVPEGETFEPRDDDQGRPRP